MTETDHSGQTGKLAGIVEPKIAAIIHELEAAGWQGGEIVRAIRETLPVAGHDQPEVLQRVREKVSQDFISDGNEG